MRIVEFVAALLIFMMAVIQLNDPDPLYWVAVYGATAWVLAWHALGKAVQRAALVVLGATAAGLLIAAPGFVDYVRSGDFLAIGNRMAGDSTWVEAAREFLGLLIASVALLYVLARGRARR